MPTSEVMTAGRARQPQDLACRIDGLTKVYGSGPAAIHALRGVNLHLVLGGGFAEAGESRVP